MKWNSKNSKTNNTGRRIPVKKRDAKSHVRSALIGIVFLVLIIAQAFYWLFANTVYPMVLGIPFGMFVVLLLICIEFIALAALYYVEKRAVREQDVT
jgi:uncharacterized membrane protein